MISATPPSAAAATAASDRPWPSSSRDGTYGTRVDPEAAEGEDELREPREPVRVEVAEHHHPLAAGAGAGDPLDDERRVRQEPRVVQPGDRRAEEGVERRLVRDAAPREDRRRERPETGRPGGLPERRVEPHRDPGRPSGDGRRSWRGACHAPLTRDLPDRAGRDAERVARRGDGLRIRAPAEAGPRDHVAARRLGRAASAARRFLSSHSCHTTSSGLALKIDE